MRQVPSGSIAVRIARIASAGSAMSCRQSQEPARSGTVEGDVEPAGSGSVRLGETEGTYALGRWLGRIEGRRLQIEDHKGRWVRKQVLRVSPAAHAFSADLLR